MFIKTDCYTIEHGDNYGYKLTISLPSDHPKSKSGIRSIATFHANLKQVAQKMVSYEIMQADAKDVFTLAEKVDSAVDRLTYWLEEAK